MDGTENPVSSLNICNRLLSFLAAVVLKPLHLGCFLRWSFAIGRHFLDLLFQDLTAQALKPVILGSPHSSTIHDHNSDSDESTCLENNIVFSDSKAEEKTGHSLPEERKTEELVSEAAIGGQQKGPPKKTVSINETVEVMTPSKSKKRKKGYEKAPSMEREREKGEEAKPLKSILKVGSNLGDEKQSA